MAAGQGIRVEHLLLLLIVAVFAVRGVLLFTLNINWDEFFYLSHIHSYLRGDLQAQLQMFHVHLFAWLAQVPGDETDQIFAARAVMFLFSGVTALLIYRIARLHFSAPVGLICVLAYVTFAEVVRHGTSFRADPIYAPLVLAAAYLVMKPARSPVQPALGGVAAAIALMVTIKTVLFLPAIGALLIVRQGRQGFTLTSLTPALAFGVALLVSFAGLFALHDMLIPKLATDVDVALAKTGYAGAIGHGNFFPRWQSALRSLMDGLLPWLAIFLGVAVALVRVVGHWHRSALRDLDVLCLALPLASLVFYRNAFPYFYVLVAACAVFAIGTTVAWLADRNAASHRPERLYSLCGIALVGFFALNVVESHLQDKTRGQRALLAEIHRLFPEPVPYIDRCSMVASYPKAGFFMSSWGIELYRAAGQPVMRALIEKRQPRFLIVNSAALDISGPYEESGFSERLRLLREDFDALKDNFVPHWGRLYVAGKILEFDSEHLGREVEILIGGVYTVEDATLIVDGKTIRPGSAVRLEKGRHHIRVERAPATAVLRWGNNIAEPTEDPPLDIFTGL